MQQLVSNELVDAVVLRNANSVAVTANLTAVNNAITVPMDGFNTASFIVTGTFAGFNGSFEASFDGGTNYIPVSALPVNSTSLTYVTATGVIAAAGGYQVVLPGATHIRLRTTAITSGTVNARAVASVSG